MYRSSDASRGAFSMLKPLCDELMASPAPTTVEQLKFAISHLPDEIVDEMQAYILYPFLYRLQNQTISNELKVTYVDGILDILKKINVKSFEVLEKVLKCFFGIIFDRSKKNSVANIPEELKLGVLNGISELLVNTDEILCLDMYKPPLNFMIVAIIFVCVNIAKEEKFRKLKLASINCIGILTSTHDSKLNADLSMKNHVLEERVVEMLRNILPGVLAALQDVATSQDNQGHEVVVSSLRAINRILCLVINDSYIQTTDQLDADDFADLVGSKLTSNSKTVKKVPPKPSKNNIEWYGFANEKLETVVRVLVPLQSHDHFKVRQELALLAGRLLMQCSRTMSSSLPHILNILVSLQEDPYNQVSQLSKNQLELYFNKNPSSKYKTVCCTSDNFFEKLQQLPRVMNDIDSGKKNALLSLLRGYVELMDSGEQPTKLLQVMTLEANVRTMNSTLVEVVCMDKSGVSLLQDLGIRDIVDDKNTRPWYTLRHIDSKETSDRVHSLLKALGASNSYEPIVDCLLLMLREEWDKASEIVFLINHMCKALENREDYSKISLLDRVLEVYLDPELWYLPVELSEMREVVSKDDSYDLEIYNPHKWEKDHVPGLYEGAVETRFTDISYMEPRVEKRDKNKCQTLSEAQSNMTVLCHLTEGLGMIASAMGIHFERYLLKTITLVLERVGSPYNCLHKCGIRCLNDISKACGHTCPEDLIRNNVDYLTHHVTIKLKKAWHTISALQILSVVLEYSDNRIVPSLHTIFTDVLVKSLDKHHVEASIVFLEVFLSFVRNVKKWFPPKLVDIKMAENECCVDQSDEFDIIKSLNLEDNVECLDNECLDDVNKTAEDMYKEDLKMKMEEDPLDYDDQVTKEDDKKEIPHHVMIVITVLKRCLNFIPSKNIKQKVLSLQILNEGLYVLEEYEDELLPIVHQIWAPLIERFADKDDFMVVNRSFELLYSMAELSKDFIKSRTVKEVLPILCDFLTKSNKESYLKDKGSSYRLTQAYRLQENLLSKIGTLVVNLNLGDKNLCDVMEAVSLYLSNRQPKPLQAHAVKCFKILLDFDEGATWHFLRQLCDNDDVLEPPTLTSLPPLNTIIGTPFGAKDPTYDTNVREIMQEKCTLSMSR